MRQNAGKAENRRLGTALCADNRTAVPQPPVKAPRFLRQYTQ